MFSRIKGQQVQTQAPKAGSDSYRSLGLKALLDALSEDRSYSVLDLGPGCGANIEFLSRFASRIRVADLYKTLVDARFFERGEEPVDEGVLERLLSVPAGERFDMILCWDLVDYLKPEEFRGLVGCLEKFCAEGTFFFAISSMLKEMPALPTAFRILDSETLLYTAGSTEMRPCPRYAPRDLALLMSGFQAHSSYILRNGRQEYLFVHL